MLNVDQLIESFGASTGLSSLRLNGNGEAELIFDRTLHVALTKINDFELELSAPLDNFNVIDAPLMWRLLEANHLGNATGSARLAIHPRDRGIIICDRLRARELNGPQLESRIGEFVRTVRFWNSSDRLTSSMREASASLGSPGTDDEHLFVIRI